jgi:Zn-dependent M32 family carboxypeptidase
MASAQDVYRQMEAWSRETALLSSTIGVLGWDQRVMMPPRWTRSLFAREWLVR